MDLAVASAKLGGFWTPVDSTGPCRLVVGEVTLFPLVKPARLLSPLGDLLRPPSSPDGAAAADDAGVLFTRADPWDLFVVSVVVGKEMTGAVGSRELPADTGAPVAVPEEFNKEVNGEGATAAELITVVPPATGPTVVAANKLDVEGCGASGAEVLATPSKTEKKCYSIIINIHSSSNVSQLFENILF